VSIYIKLPRPLSRSPRLGLSRSYRRSFSPPGPFNTMLGLRKAHSMFYENKFWARKALLMRGNGAFGSE